jgi:hypothetical protein
MERPLQVFTRAPKRSCVARIQEVQTSAEPNERTYHRGVIAVSTARPPPSLLRSELPKVNPMTEPVVVVLADAEGLPGDELPRGETASTVECDERAVIVERALPRRNRGTLLNNPRCSH